MNKRFKDFEFNLKLVYWKFGARLRGWFDYIDFKISEWEDWTEHYSKGN